MSMLAEPRRKQKWSVDPRNSAWSNDDSKFGQKMLERMGWSKGKGLGRSEQGDVNPIKVKVKNDSYGLGTNGSYEDNWIAHQDDFNDLLAQLNDCHGQNGNTETKPEEQKSFSLEEKSKTSKKRVHYMKFAKGKDLSSRSATDLNCIFGKRAKATVPDSEQESSTDSHGNAPETPTPTTDEAATKTVTSALTMQEYFAQRMAQLKTARGQPEEPKKKKKKKKSEADVEEAGESSKKKKREIEDAMTGNDCEENEPQTKKKKKRKNKMEVETETLLEKKTGEEEELELVVPKKSKKHKKKKEQ
ncbi:PIN2/TERF1-interacting telomerase inhibitor 1 [Corythoichthys intestinalis]|uniref:PIN2/TERF1-interacting telomerase inhibitor 1 n=1 Tax=Corythoichthys intestinalis TaxID=161448 RepID=UPI0025A57929|nr:PIN2/TERF1-interacting telomerase inhibitor 1 [Corythoichthys intestinalis]XP_061806383.1 PIN2/TERF1-interacting telomerase inhibitor 1-like [Nerophis lumbriciformis]